MGERLVRAVHGIQDPPSRTPFEIGLAGFRARHTTNGAWSICSLGTRRPRLSVDVSLCGGPSGAPWRGIRPRVRIGAGVGFKHLETDGRSAFGSSSARARICRDVSTAPAASATTSGSDPARTLMRAIWSWKTGWAGGRARVLGSEHTGFPLEAPIIQTPICSSSWAVVCRGADIGTNAVLLPQCNQRAGAIVGARARW